MLKSGGRGQAVCLSLVLVGWAGLCTAGASPSTVLTKVVSTRALGFGGAAAAIGGDPTLLWVNPACSARAEGSSLMFAGQRGYLHEGAGQFLWSWASPDKPGVITIGACYADAGSADLMTVEGHVLRMNLQSDFVGVVNYGRAVNPTVAVGVSAKALSSVLFNTYRASAVCLDGGTNVRLSQVFSLGGALLNAGTPLVYSKTSEPLPMTVRLGGRGAFWWKGIGRGGPGDTITAVIDVDYRAVEQDQLWRGGVEYAWRGMVMLRGGVRGSTRDALGAYAGGLGIRSGKWRLDYGIQFGSVLGIPQTLSITLTY